MEKKRNRIRSKVPGQALTLGINRILWRWMKGKVPGRTEVEQNLRCLYTGDNIKERLEQYYAAKTGLLLKIATAGVAVTILLLATSLQKTELFEGVFLLRREKSYEKELTLKVEGEAARDMTIDVEPRELTREESRALLEKIKSRMDMYILGDNRTLDEVRSDLKLVTEIEGTPVTVSWELDSYDVLSLDGGLRPENIKEEGSIVELTAHMVCYGETAVYQAYAKVLPPLLNPEESFARELQEKLAQLQEEGKEAKEKELPGEVQGKALHWEEKVSGTPVMVLVLTLVCIPFYIWQRIGSWVSRYRNGRSKCAVITHRLSVSWCFFWEPVPQSAMPGSRSSGIIR